MKWCRSMCVKWAKRGFWFQGWSKVKVNDSILESDSARLLKCFSFFFFFFFLQTWFSLFIYHIVLHNLDLHTAQPCFQYLWYCSKKTYPLYIFCIEYHCHIYKKGRLIPHLQTKWQITIAIIHFSSMMILFYVKLHSRWEMIEHSATLSQCKVYWRNTAALIQCAA